MISQVIIGGAVPGLDSLEEVWAYDFGSVENVWTRLPDLPEKLRFPAGCYDPTTNSIYVHGGYLPRRNDSLALIISHMNIQHDNFFESDMSIPGQSYVGGVGGGQETVGTLWRLDLEQVEEWTEINYTVVCFVVLFSRYFC